MELTKEQHTRGPWFANNNSDHKIYGLPCSEIYNSTTEIDDGEWIAYVRGTTKNQRESNARLIAAAPELLEALKTFGKFIDDFDVEGMSLNELSLLTALERKFNELSESAIAKAEGGSNG
jgi:hypothetical protein